MARVCQVTGKAPMVGNRVSHANNKTKRRFMPNLQYRRFWVESENRWVRLRVTNAALRTIDKNGIEAVWRTFAPAAKSNRSSPWRKVFVKKSNWLLPPVQVTSTQPLRTNAILVAKWKCPSTIRLPAST